MSGIILTSTGPENPVIGKEILQMLGKNAEEASALWIPTAAIDEEAKAVLPKCRNDLLRAGFQNLENAIPFLSCKLDVHYDTGHAAGSYDFAEEKGTRLTNQSAIVLTASEQKMIA